MRAALLVLLLVAGCTLPTQEELDQRSYDAENWEMCKLAYKMGHKAWHSDHPHVPGRKHTYWEVRDDLVKNFCSQIISPDYWAP